MSSILKEHPQIITIYSAFIITGAFIYREIENPMLKIFGSIFLFSGMFGVFLIAFQIYWIYFGNILESGKKKLTLSNLISSYLFASSSLLLFVVGIMFIYYLFITKFFEKDLLFLVGFVIFLLMILVSFILIIWAPLTISVLNSIAKFFKKEKNTTKTKVENEIKENFQPYLGKAIILGVMFALLGFIGGLNANFTWWLYLQMNPETTRIAGYFMMITFWLLILGLLYLGKKFGTLEGGKSLKKEQENPKEPDKFSHFSK